MTAFYRGQETLEARAEMTMTVKDPRQPKVVRTQQIKQTLKLRRPDRMALVSSGEGAFFSSPSVYLDRGKATMKLEGQGWVQTEGIPSASALFLSPELGYDEVARGNIVFDQNLALSFLNKLLFAEVGQGWEEDLDGLRYVGEEAVGKLEAHHLVLSTETQQFGQPATMDLSVWIQQGAQPFLLKLKPDMSKLFPKAPEGQPQMEISMVGTWTGWDVSPNFETKDFEAPKPDEKEPVFPSFDALMQAQMASQNPALSLTGTEAADFSLPLLGGGKFGLKDQRDKRITVIGFWTTWLGREDNSLKALAGIQEATKGQAVSVIAVNLGEKEAEVKSFLEGFDPKIEVPVVLDTEQTLVPKYKIRSIPQTVVVGQDGEVKQVHIGVDEAFAEELLHELKALLAEKESEAKTP